MSEDKISFAMDLAAMLTIEELSMDMGRPLDEVFIDFMGSNTAAMLFDDETKLWWDGPLSIAAAYKAERNGFSASDS